MKTPFVALMVGLAPACLAADLPRSTPEEQGVSSSALLKFVEAADRIDAMNSVMVVRHGHVIAEGWWSPYSAASPHSLYSLSKSFTSTAVGMAVAEGKLSVDDPVLKFFPEDAPAEPSKNLKAMRVPVLSGRMYMSCRQAEQPVGGGLNLFLGDPGSQNRTDFLAQQFTAPRPPLVRVARAA